MLFSCIAVADCVSFRSHFACLLTDGTCVSGCQDVTLAALGLLTESKDGRHLQLRDLDLQPNGTTCDSWDCPSGYFSAYPAPDCYELVPLFSDQVLAPQASLEPRRCQDSVCCGEGGEYMNTVISRNTKTASQSSMAWCNCRLLGGWSDEGRAGGKYLGEDVLDDHCPPLLLFVLFLPAPWRRTCRCLGEC